VGAERTKRLLKHGVYRTLGETVATVAAQNGANGANDALLRVLLYHKVNDGPTAPLTVSVSLFDEQLSRLRELQYNVVDLDTVLAHYRDGRPLPSCPVLITFDDGYRDNLDNAAPVLERHGFPSVSFVPIAYLDGPQPLPHERRFALHGRQNETLDWGALAELEAAGMRVESHGISHSPFPRLTNDEAARELAVSKQLLEERLGRPVRAFAYVKGAVGRRHLPLVAQAGYELAFTSTPGLNPPDADRLRLHRYNVEPYAMRTFELVLTGACDLMALKDTVAGTYARRALNAALGTSSK
jgi:peptidoglycan/xylan/chitin deacetylase (PgdA/CDA1 family)